MTTNAFTTVPSQAAIAGVFYEYRKQLGGYGEFIEFAEALLRDSDYDEQVAHGFANWNTDESKNDIFVWFSESGWGVCFNQDGSYLIERKY